jgi:hypothetical protein
MHLGRVEMVSIGLAVAGLIGPPNKNHMEVRTDAHQRKDEPVFRAVTGKWMGSIEQTHALTGNRDRRNLGEQQSKRRAVAAEQTPSPPTFAAVPGEGCPP